ncbi:MAG TPA: DegT/DnrJ/EryC1/StrS family aminotransferase [Candidatus Bathyarchaeia archaeon]|nr:DegT/DnrJ/EryC1/StrS family aminotransferase [Candidatus Bathyarchaeia archaeon]
MAQHRDLEEALVDAFRRALRTARFVNGPEVTAFESEFAAYLGASGCVGVSSGTDALRFALAALGVRPGDEVVTTPHTFIATTEAVSQVGGVLRFVDIDPDTMTIDPRAVEAAVTRKTVGILPVHLYGHPADLDPLLAVAKKRGLWVLEDACQAHGARYRGRAVGSLGDLAAFSFYPGKNLGACGDAGAVTAGRAELLDAVRRLREHGQAQKYFHETEGYTGRLDAIQAAFLRVKLPLLEGWIEGRRRGAAWYRQALGDLADVELPKEAAWARHVYHLYVVRAERRDALQAHLEKAGISTGLHYPMPLHLQKAYAHLGFGRGSFPHTERTSDRLLSLPMFPELTESDVGRVADSVRSFYR